MPTADDSIRRMRWTYSGSGSRDEDSQGDEAKVRREMASISGERMPWCDKWTRLRRWLLRR